MHIRETSYKGNIFPEYKCVKETVRSSNTYRKEKVSSFLYKQYKCLFYCTGLFFKETAGLLTILFHKAPAEIFWVVKSYFISYFRNI